MKVRRPFEEEELEAYFGGELDGRMGLKSWLGRWEDHGPTRGGTSMASPPEPGGQALEAAREMNRVELALALCDRSQALVLRARFTPRGPYAPLATFGELGPVLLVLSGVGSILDGYDEDWLREALRSGSAVDAREALEFVPPVNLDRRLAELERAAASIVRRDHRRRAQCLRGQLKSVAGLAVRDALASYVDARARARRLERADRIQKLRRGLEA